MNASGIRKLAGGIALGVSLAVAGMFGPAQAQEFPSEPITIVVGWPAGGGQDGVGRLVAEFLDQQLPVSVVVTNIPGAAAATGIREVEESEPNGYTIGTMGLHAIAQSYINPNASDINKIDPLVLVNIDPAALTVRTDTGIDSLEEFIEYTRANPGAMINGNDSPGGFSFLNAEFVERNLDIEMTKVPYQGYAPTVAALVAGEVNSATLPVPMVQQLHQSGDVKVLAVASEERHFAVPDVPTFKELGHDYVFTDYVMIFAPVGLPDDVKQTLETALLDAMATEGFKSTAEKMGLIVNPLGSKEASALLRRMDDEVYPVMLDAGLVEVRER